MEEMSGLILGIAMGIIMIWTSVLIVLASLPLARREVNSKDYNYRPFAPAFIKSLSDDEANAINERFAKLAIRWGVATVVFGIMAMIAGIVPSFNGYLPAVIAIPYIAIFILMLLGYRKAYKVSLNHRIDKG